MLDPNNSFLRGTNDYPDIYLLLGAQLDNLNIAYSLISEQHSSKTLVLSKNSLPCQCLGYVRGFSVNLLNGFNKFQPHSLNVHFGRYDTNKQNGVVMPKDIFHLSLNDKYTNYRSIVINGEETFLDNAKGKTLVF